MVEGLREIPSLVWAKEGYSGSKAHQMKCLIGVVAVAINLTGSLAMAQSPAQAIVGRWVSQSGYCGQAIYDITNVDANGTVRGTFICSRTNWGPTIGDAIGPNAMKGTLVSTHFVMVNAQGGGNDLILNGSRLEGSGKVNGGSPPSPTAFYKQ